MGISHEILWMDVFDFTCAECVKQKVLKIKTGILLRKAGWIDLCSNMFKCSGDLIYKYVENTDQKHFGNL